MIITYIYHALIDALSTHMMHINVNTIFYLHVEQNPTHALYILFQAKNSNRIRTIYSTETHTSDFILVTF